MLLRSMKLTWSQQTQKDPQVVGSSRLPLLQSQWTWDLDVNQDAGLSRAMVLMEATTTIKLHFSIDRVSYISSDGIGLNGDGLMTGFHGRN